MEDFDVFTNEINFSKPVYNNILNNYVKDIPSTPSGPNYQSGRKLIAEECFSGSNEIEGAFHLSEAVSASLRTLAVYRDEQLRSSGNKIQKITRFVKPVQDLIERNPLSKEEEALLAFLPDATEDLTDRLKNFAVDEDLPFYKKYMRFGSDNNVENFRKILKELPKEWTIIQLTAPYNPNENLKPLPEYRTEINSIYLTMFSNDYLDTMDGPITVNVPANVIKEGEKPLFTELYSLLDENYKTIDNAQFLNNKRLVQNYWSKREDIDLRMKSVISVMDKHWLGGFSCLLTGKLRDSALREKVVRLVDSAVSDWGFIKLTKKQKILLYNLIESCPSLSSQQIKSCIRRILTDQGNIEEIRRILKTINCDSCDSDLKLTTEVCFKCLSKCFEQVHNFSVVDGIRAFSQVANQVKDGDEFSGLRKAKRYPVILIVDEMLDTFPWESLPILNHQPVCRMENIHFLYALYKIHEKDIVDGYFTTKADVGRYIINPEKNLERMELRMSSFVRYWCGGWSGYIGEPPPPDRFLSYLADADVFLYCGHGDGCQFAGGGGVAAARGRALALLSGCGSVRLARAPGRAPPSAAHHHLHVAGCPMVIGMLWEVTDLEVDKVVSALVSLCVPSEAPADWASVGKARWSQGVIDTNVEQSRRVSVERDLLRAVAKSRAATAFALIASSVVARGLPVAVLDT
ncbi:separin [Epargyreus clarus]|uniref:separin n=1 Tax=Epargyreus clarus TaxID=520877 RepID=UPI003C2EF662